MATSSPSKETETNSCPPLLVKKAIPQAIIPSRQSEFAAGYDLSSVGYLTIEPYGKAVVGTGLHIAIPAGHYGRIAPRSGLAAKNHIDVGAGVIDCDYRGLIQVVLFNHGSEPFVIGYGDRIAQLILEKISTPPVVEVETLDNTVRGGDGFGSTGVSCK